MDHGPWTMDHRPCTIVHGPWTMCHGPWTMNHDPWSIVNGPWTMVHGPWTMDHGEAMPLSHPLYSLRQMLHCQSTTTLAKNGELAVLRNEKSGTNTNTSKQREDIWAKNTPQLAREPVGGSAQPKRMKPYGPGSPPNWHGNQLVALRNP